MGDMVMDEHAASSNPAMSAQGDAALQWPEIRTLVLDIADVADTFESQDAVTDFIWHMVDRDYQIFLCSSKWKEEAAGQFENEDFAHPRLTWLQGDMPPTQQQVKDHPALVAATTLWISDMPAVLQWAAERSALTFSMREKTASFAEAVQVGSWSELANLLDPTTQTARQIADAIAEVRRSQPKMAVLVGLGGPPASGYDRLALEVKRVLEAGADSLVELLDTTPLFPVGASSPDAAGPLSPNSPIMWWVDTVLRPAANGERVYIEAPPSNVPNDMKDLFPLFVSEESVVLLFGEAVFHRALRPLLDLAVLVEVDPSETARRDYEIPEGEAFDEAMTQQYLEKDGRAYAQYLEANQVVKLADLHVNGNSPRRLVLLPNRVVAN